MAINKYLDYTGLQQYDTKIKELITNSDSETLQSSKDYADSLSSNYDPAGTAQTKMQELASGQVATNTAAIAKLNGSNTTEGSVAKQVKDAKDEVQGQIGTLGDLDTTAKSDLVNAINEVRQAVEVGGTGSVVTIDTSSTTSGMAKSYTIKQGSSTVGTIDIPTDYTNSVIDSKITTAVANAEHLKREIVEDLPSTSSADAHTIYMLSKDNGSGNQQYDEYMLINGTFEKIGDSAVDLTNYATKNEVSTAKSEAISTASADATSKANSALEDAKEYADSLASNYATAAQGAKADTALQAADIVESTVNGSISVKGKNIPIHGLGSAAYVATTSFDAAGTAQNLVTTLQNGAVASNTSAISALDSRVDALEAADTYVAITEEEITALFEVA